MVAMESESSCGPHPKDHPPPPTAQDPNPTVVILSPLEPSRRVGNAMLFSFFYRTNFIGADEIPQATQNSGPHLANCNAAGSLDHFTEPKAITFTPVSNVCALAQSGASKRHGT